MHRPFSRTAECIWHREVNPSETCNHRIDSPSSYFSKALSPNELALALKRGYPYGYTGGCHDPASCDTSCHDIESTPTTNSAGADANSQSLPPNVKLIANAWPSLPKHIRAAIMSLVHTALQTEPGDGGYVSHE